MVKLVGQLGLPLKNVKGELKTADGTEHTINAYTHLPISYNDKNEILPVLLLPTLPDYVIFGIDFWNAFAIKPVCFSLEAELSKDGAEETNQVALTAF